MDGYILAVDQGTSGSKAHIFGHDGAVLACSFRETAQFHPEQGWAEQDPGDIWRKTSLAIEDALGKARILPEDILAIGISNQRCTTVAWNRVTGEAIGRAIGWQDRRGWNALAPLPARDMEELERRNGFGMMPNLSIGKLRWLLDNDRSVQRAAVRGELLFGTIDSWLVWKLSGGEAHVTDLSNASTTGLLNIDSLGYDDWIIGKFGIPREALPGIRSSSEVYARTDPAAFFGASIPISACIGDQPAAAFAQGCRPDGAIKNSYGTGAFMIRSTGPKRIPARPGTIAPVLWSIGGDLSFGLEGYADVSGEVLGWLHDGLGIMEEASEADGLAMCVPDTGGVYFVPAMVGLPAPRPSPNARGTIFGINFGTTRHHIVRAALESIAYQTRDSLWNIEAACGRGAESLRVDGGGAQSDFLMQFQADILGIPVERPTIVEASSLGAAYLAGLAVGYWASVDEAVSHWRLDTRFEPRISAERREELYGGWLRAVEYAGLWGAAAGATGPGPRPRGARVDTLSPREREVMALYSSGMPMREIAAALCTSVKTVEKQRHDAMRKLGAANLVNAVRICIEEGIVEGRRA